MAVFRVEKNKSFTVMSNYHLRDKALTLKAKGLLSLMLSLPEDWDYTLSGLSTISREGVDSIRTAVNELEKSGYVVRSQTRTDNGKFQGNEYLVYEMPFSCKKVASTDPSPIDTLHGNCLPHYEENANRILPEYPLLDFPITDNPTTVFPISENPTQLNKEERNKDIFNKDQSIYLSNADRMNEIDDFGDTIKKNIEYDILWERFPHERINELYGLLLATINSRKKIIKIGSEDIPAADVRRQFLQINRHHIEYVMDCIDQNTTKVRNIKQYLLTSLYNAPMTMDHYYSSLVNHDFAGK